MSQPKVTTQQVKHIATLANIPINDQESQKLASAFEETLEVVNQLNDLDVSSTPSTHQVTGLENVWREDEIDEKRMFTQAQALANASKTHQGFIVVDRVIDNE
ncbi:MAG: Asp-tRNA(Asn)/Glu-tRNA(Gln) amidotransferase subunit GatC [Patescibacteria group bacterium]